MFGRQVCDYIWRSELLLPIVLGARGPNIQEPEALTQRTIGGASRFLDLPIKDCGSLLKFDERGTCAHIDVVGVSNQIPWVSRGVSSTNGR